jgi:hypothetical protein
MVLSEEQRVGALIFLVAAVLMAAALVCSNGWGTRVDLYLFEVNWRSDDGFIDPDIFGSQIRFTVWTKYILGLLVLLAGYGIARFFSLIPPVFKKLSSSKTLPPEHVKAD